MKLIKDLKCKLFFKPKDYNFNSLDEFLNLLREKFSIIEKIEEDAQNEIKMLNAEIELLPKEKHKDFEDKIKEIEIKRDKKIQKVVDKFKKSLKTFIVLEDKYLPVLSKELVDTYSIISYEFFRTNKILFISETKFFEIMNCIGYYSESKYFKEVFNVIIVKLKKVPTYDFEVARKVSNIKFIN